MLRYSIGKRLLDPCWLTALAWLVAATVQAQTSRYSGKVLAVHDGDSLVVVDRNGTPHQVRLADIDAPENDQPYGAAAKRYLTDLVFRNQVEVHVLRVDQYGRQIAYVIRDGKHINASMLNAGLAWWSTLYGQDKRLIEFARVARQERRGLWGADEIPVPPWAWRKGERTAQTLAPLPESSGTCDKTYCSQMDSCEEATYYLRACKLSTLDADGDGTPCEALCRAELEAITGPGRGKHRNP